MSMKAIDRIMKSAVRHREVWGVWPKYMLYTREFERKLFNDGSLPKSGNIDDTIVLFPDMRLRERCPLITIETEKVKDFDLA